VPRRAPAGSASRSISHAEGGRPTLAPPATSWMDGERAYSLATGYVARALTELREGRSVEGRKTVSYAVLVKGPGPPLYIGAKYSTRIPSQQISSVRAHRARAPAGWS